VQRAQFEVIAPAADVTLLVRKDLPPEGLRAFDYQSTNPGTNSEIVVLRPNSAPVALTPGEWFVNVVNTSGANANYVVRATQWDASGLPLVVSLVAFKTNSLCLTWNSLPGATYVVQGKGNLAVGAWANASDTIVADNVATTFCLPVPSPYNSLRVSEGVAVDTSSAAQFLIAHVVVNAAGVILSWQAPVSLRFQVQWKNEMTSVWNTIPTVIISASGDFAFTDDGAQSAPLGAVRHYRLALAP